ncbi:SDR family oxidoreductase [Nocardioides immobilis]|uniref:SDR family oxidoreductase n=1 Tax=Nocardioides immobilis TaxID=2049295 RepID=A0A417Y0M5_9ACTN|nr:SDR family oxidoreductase [Nocardioides immobilis]RHW26210.1 SDR family oxidoreductase [Nocardioides immobilis]
MSARDSMFSLDGKRIIVTGATAGIGRSLAGALVRQGAQVVLLARRKELLDTVVAELGDNASAIAVDLSDAGDTRSAISEAIDTMGGVEVLVNNAAYIAGGRRAEDETLEDITQTLNVNLVAPIVAAQTVFPFMKAAGAGSIINVTSVVASVGIGRLPQAVYSASKGGLTAITREWAAQWSRYGIRINALAPGFIRTEMTDATLEVDKIRDWVEANTMLPRIGTPEDFDGMVVYLASDSSSFVTGQVLTVDGGWTAR